MTTISSEVVGIQEVMVRLQTLPGVVRDSIAAAVYGQALRVERIIKTEKLLGDPVQRRTGRLQRSVHTEMNDDATSVTAVVGSDVEYAKYIEDGTRPHEIVAMNAKALAFALGGVMVFRKRVQHPGTPAYKVFSGTLAEEASTIRNAIETAAKKAVTNEP